MNRRKFLTFMGSAGLAATAIGTLPEAEAASGGKFSTYPDSFAVLHDTSRCIGCRKCEMGCQNVNDLPLPKRPLDDLTVLDKKRRTSADAWTVVNKYKVNGKDVFCKTQCNHCLDPACAAACFVKAFRKGTVWPERNKVVVRKPEPELAEPLEEAGFSRVMLDYVAYR